MAFKIRYMFFFVFELRVDLVIDLFGFGRGNCYCGESIGVSMESEVGMGIGTGIGTGIGVSSITSMSIGGDTGIGVSTPIGSNGHGGNSRGGNHGGNFMDRSDGKSDFSSSVGVKDSLVGSGSFSNFGFYSQIGRRDLSSLKSSMSTSLSSFKGSHKFGLGGLHLFGVFKGNSGSNGQNGSENESLHDDGFR